jgi:hypothetical protein
MYYFPDRGLAVLTLLGRMLLPVIFSAIAIERKTSQYSLLFFWSLIYVMAQSWIIARFDKILSEKDCTNISE